MAELTSHVLVAAEQLAVHNDADTDTVGHGDENKVVVGRQFVARQPHLRQDAGLRCILDLNGQAGGGRQWLTQIDVMPIERRCVEDPPAAMIYHARHHEPHTLAVGSPMVRLQ